MKEFVGKSCKVWVKVEGHDYFYTVRKVLRYDDPHLTFLDKYSQQYTFHKDNIMEIREVKEAW